MRRWPLFLLFLAVPAIAAPDTPGVVASGASALAAPGRIARLHLGNPAQPPSASLGGHRLLVRYERGEWLALAGIPLSAKARSTLAVEVTYADGRREVRPITVVRRKY